MNKFTIFTICTENYKDAVDFFLPSWLKLDSVESIVIYTDFDLKYCDKRVEVRNKIEKGGNWLDIVGLKAVFLKDFLREFQGDYFAFIDIDCYILEEISDVFNGDFDIAVTRMFHKKRQASSGVWFCRNNDKIIQFAHEWWIIQEEYRARGNGVKVYNSSFSQNSFSDIVHREFKYYDKFPNDCLKVLPLDKNIYNYERTNIRKWVDNIINHNPKILHFKGRSWRKKKSHEIFNKL